MDKHDRVRIEQSSSSTGIVPSVVSGTTPVGTTWSGGGGNTVVGTRVETSGEGRRLLVRMALKTVPTNGTTHVSHLEHAQEDIEKEEEEEDITQKEPDHQPGNATKTKTANPKTSRAGVNAIISFCCCL
jgi:hypothetical protein